MERLIVTLERDSQKAIVIFRADDYRNSVKGDRIKWGSGKMWAVVAVEAQQ